MDPIIAYKPAVFLSKCNRASAWVLGQPFIQSGLDESRPLRPTYIWRRPPAKNFPLISFQLSLFFVDICLIIL
jgi:hypothetical protein